MTGRRGPLTTLVAVGAALLLVGAAVISASEAPLSAAGVARAVTAPAMSSSSSMVHELPSSVRAGSDDRAASRSFARSARRGVPPLRFPGFGASRRATAMADGVTPPAASGSVVPSRSLRPWSPLWVRPVWTAPALA